MRLNPRLQGDLGEASAMQWLAYQGWPVAVPLFHSPDWDLIAEVGDRLLRVHLFAVVGDGRRWFIPAEELGGGSGIRLGGPKYAPFEVEPGPPLRPGTHANGASRLPTATTRGDVRVVKGEGL